MFIGLRLLPRVRAWLGSEACYRQACASLPAPSLKPIAPPKPSNGQRGLPGRDSGSLPGHTRETGANRWEPALKQLLPLARGKDAEHLAVLRHGASRNLDAIAFGEKLDDLLVG